MTAVTADVFDLPARLSAKADPALIDRDAQQFAAVTARLEASVAELSDRLDVLRRLPGRSGQAALDRDLEIHRLSARLRTLRRFRLDLCLGRIVAADDPEPVYIGRLGLTDADGRRLLVDWRAEAAAPYFAATLADPMGLESRRRYRWTGGRVTDYWDEVFTSGALRHGAALDEDSALLAALRGSRSARMRDVLGTIQADQDAIIRASSHGALVVDGGPGTGKTVVALHRAAYLLYADPRLSGRRGGVLFVGPHQPYLAYIADVLPSLGEDGVRTCTLRELVPEGAGAVPEPDPHVAALKSSSAMVDAVERAVASVERPPTTTLVVETDWADVAVGPADWADVFDAAEPGTTHDEARDQVWDALLGLIAGRLPGVPEAVARRSLLRNEALAETFDRAWPLLDTVDVVAGLWADADLLSECAPWLDGDDLRALQRPDPRAWTVADLPLLDAARARVGDPESVRDRHRREATLARERERMSEVLDYLISADDGDEQLITPILRGEDARNSLVDRDAAPALEVDRLAGPFAHVVIDEAQELTDAEWRMILRRCPSRSLTVVGDRAQARHGFAETWRGRLERVGIRAIAESSLTVNYRTPEEIMAEAAPVIRAALPDANVPTSVRRSGIPVAYGAAADVDAVLDDWLAVHDEGTACVIGAAGVAERPRVRVLDPDHVKGLEFDLVVLVDPDRFGGGIEGAVDRYVAMTRATQRLVLLTS
ncbi:RNA polymerase recycling motor ATPase HelR [Agromyces tropicus]|uniref:RNA polymerase recycling motor ATPase HelR n=1 Tax=Agromyces tropicus TaxID=555371 RepID=A0ABP5FA59_9MICO